MKRRFFIKLNFVLTAIFLMAFIGILVVINPFEANVFQFILFYIVVFGLVLGILNLISARYIKIPFWLRILIAIAIIFILIVQGV